MPTGYSSARKLTKVIGRIKYLTDKERQEEIVAKYNTTDMDFWKQLASENQKLFRYTNKTLTQKYYVKNKDGVLEERIRKIKCCEAREFIISLPKELYPYAGDIVRTISENFKAKYGVECFCAVHNKKSGNLHIHLIFAERTKLKEPIVEGQKKAPRTYYYDADGKQCKKANAVKIVPKGTVTKEGITRYFSEKIDRFSTMEFALEVKEDILNNMLGLAKFDSSRYFATKHIGKNNPKEKELKEFNELISELNYYFDQVEGEYNLDGMTPKQKFCELIGSNNLYVPQIDEIKDFMRKFEKLYPLNEKTAQNANKSLSEITPEKLIEDYREINSDISKYFDSFECAAHQLETYAVWEENGRKDWVYKKDPIFETYGFEKPRQDINALIEKYSQKAKYYPNYNANRYKKIQPQSTMKVAFDIAKELLKNLVDLLESISQKFLDLTGQRIKPTVKSLEQEEKSRDEEEYELW